MKRHGFLGPLIVARRKEPKRPKWRPNPGAVPVRTPPDPSATSKFSPAALRDPSAVLASVARAPFSDSHPGDQSRRELSTWPRRGEGRAASGVEVSTEP